MSHLISSYIERELSLWHPVALPWVGVLSIERCAARYDHDSGAVLAPYDTLRVDELTKEHSDEDFFAKLATYNKDNTNVGGYLDFEQFLSSAQQDYEQWWAESRNNASELVIEGVCTIDLSQGKPYIVAIDEGFSEILLPFNESIITAQTYQPNSVPLRHSVQSEESSYGTSAQYEEVDYLEPQHQPSLYPEPHYQEPAYQELEYAPVVVQRDFEQNDAHTPRPQHRREQRTSTQVATTALAWRVLAIVAFVGSALYLLYEIFWKN